MIKIAVCDDEAIFLDIITKELETVLLSQGISEYEINIFSSGMDISSLKNEISDYQIVFLDINMEELNGLDTARNIRKYDEDIFIVFITAYMDYALEGYRMDAVRFILKDMLKEMLPECIEVILQRLHLKSSKVIKDFLEGRKEIFLDRIIYIESNRHKLYFNMWDSRKEKYSLYGKVDELEKELQGYGFLRIHKSFLVNRTYIEDIIPYVAIMRNGRELPIPRDKYKKVKAYYFESKGELI